MTVVITVSILIKTISLVMVLYTFKNLTSPQEPKQSDIYTKYFVLKKKYTLLRFSLLFVAALILLEAGSMVHAFFTTPAAVDDMQMLFSDFIFLGLIVLLTKIYQFRTAFGAVKST